jgi:hypothetical protein
MDNFTTGWIQVAFFKTRRSLGPLGATISLGFYHTLVPWLARE